MPPVIVRSIVSDVSAVAVSFAARTGTFDNFAPVALYTSAFSAVVPVVEYSFFAPVPSVIAA